MNITNQSQITANSQPQKVAYVTSNKYKRPVYYLDLAGRPYMERFLRYDDARDEARTVVRKVIKHCRRKGLDFAGFLSVGLLTKADGKRSTVTRIIDEVPPDTLHKVFRSLSQFEKWTKKPVTVALSIRPLIGWDAGGYFVKGVELEDDPEKIYRKYPENRLVDAF